MPLRSMCYRHHILPAFGAAVLTTVAALMMLGGGRSVSAELPAPASQLTTLHSDNQRYSVQLTVPAVERRPHETQPAYERITIDGYSRLGRVGYPDVPLKTLWVALPPGAEPQLTWRSLSETTVLDVSIPPVPTQIADYDGGDVGAVPQVRQAYRLATEATADGWFPRQPVALGAVTHLRDQRVVPVHITPLQVNGARATARLQQALTITVAFTYPNGTVQAVEPRLESAPFEQMLARTVANYAAAQAWRTRPTLAAPPLSPCLASGQPAYRLSVAESGMYAVTPTDLGWTTPVASAALHVCLRDQRVAIAVEDGGDGWADGDDKIVFYGEALRTHETETNVYWLTVDSTAAPVRMATLGSASGTPVAAYGATVRMERDERYFTNYPLADAADSYDHWFADLIGVGQSVSESFTASDVVSGTATLAVELWGFNDTVHPVQLALNGTVLGEPDQRATSDCFDYDDDAEAFVIVGSGKYDGPCVVTASFSADWLNDGPNTLDIAVLPNDAGAAHSVLLNWASVAYSRAHRATAGRLLFDQPVSGSWRYAIDGVTGARIYDVTDGANVKQIVGHSGGTFAVAQSDAAFPARYAVTTTAALLTPAIERDTPSTLRDTANSADYIIITSPLFLDDGYGVLAPLVALRQSHGLRVAVVTVQDIFDEFGYGLYDPWAIRHFLAYAYSEWDAPAPTYVLLAGDASHDHLNRNGNNILVDANGVPIGNANAVPTYLRSGVDSYLGETAADNQYVAFLDDTQFGVLPAMHIGRLPAGTPAEMAAMVAKIVQYESADGTSAWQAGHLFVTDNESAFDVSQQRCEEDPATRFLPGLTFFGVADAFIRDHVAPSQRTTRLYFADQRCYEEDDEQPWYAFGTDELRARFVDAFSHGQQFVVYTGHAGIDQWGAEGEGFVTATDAAYVNNGAALPIMLPMACLEGQYQRQDAPGGSSVSEAFVRRAGGGAIASFAPTGLHVATAHDLLLTGFYDAVYVDDVATLGEAVYGAKLALPLNPVDFYAELHDTYMLLGDPALRLRSWQPSAAVQLPMVQR